jgi:NADH-quinone oxidoreductase subunit I
MLPSDLESHVSALKSGVRHLFRRRMTLRYPESKMKLPDGYRYPKAGFKGRHVLDMARCTGCSICEYICRNIAGAIGMVPVQGTFARNRKAIFPQIDYGYCVFCGFCVDSCSFNALTMGQDFELSSYDKQQLIYTPRQLTTTPAASGRAKLILTKKEAYHREY